MNGYSNLGMTNTELGDRVEEALAARGWKPLNGNYRQGSFDLEAPDGTLVEVKACAENAQEWKVKSKAREISNKLAESLRLGKDAATVIAVVFEDHSALVFRREGLGCFRLSKSSVACGDYGMWTLVEQLEMI